MKKVLCTILVAMLTMVSMTFVQASSMPVSYFTIRNKTTNQVETVKINKFNSLGDNKFEYDVNFFLGVYMGDQIEITYTPAVAATTPQLAWTYSYGSISSPIPGTASTASLTVPYILYDGKTLAITCDYQGDGLVGATPVSKLYTCYFKNTHNDKRFYSEYSAISHQLRVRYVHYEEAASTLAQPPFVSWYSTDGGLLLGSGYMDSNGIITFDTKGRTGIFIVRVRVDGITLPAEEILLY